MKGYIKISNKDNKSWVLPCENIKVALCLYQPSSRKGKILKRILPWMVPVSIIPEKLYNRFGIGKSNQMISITLDRFLHNQFLSEKDILFSVFMGTPGIHQKITIQVFSGEKILGYCKVSNNEMIYTLFKNEQKILNNLSENGITNIPQCLFCGKLDSNTFVFVQSTTKTINSVTHHSIGALEMKFLSRLAENTRKNVHYEETDLARSVETLLSQLPLLLENEYPINSLKKACKDINTYYEKQSVFSAMHRDFTPWNMFVEKNNLFVFDFEYAGLLYPPYLDAIHFIVQSGIYELNMSAYEIYLNFVEAYSNGVLKGIFQSPNIALKAYLIDIISLYLSREKDNLGKTNCRELFDTWIKLCDYADGNDN